MHMATNVEIDPALIQQALLLGGKRTKREVIEEALHEYVSRREQQRILNIFKPAITRRQQNSSTFAGGEGCRDRTEIF